MRSQLVFGAMANVSNRYLLTTLASKATRKFHRSHDRIQKTTNAVLVRFSAMNSSARTGPVGIGLANGDFRSTPNREVQVNPRWRSLPSDTSRIARMPQIGRIASEVLLPMTPLHGSSDPGTTNFSNISADPALRWDTPSRPLALRAEPPNSAQPLPFS
jgi:hypothetical protein